MVLSLSYSEYICLFHALKKFIMREEQKFDDFAIEEKNYEFTLKSSKLKDSAIQIEFKSESVATTTTKQTRTTKFQVESEQIKKAFEQEQQKEERKELSKHEQTKLMFFLKRAYPLISSALNETAQLKLYHQYVPTSSSTRKETVELYGLSNQPQKSYEIEMNLEITDIQWSSNGLMIAASYGKLEHEGSCNHKTYICAWNISKRDFQPDKASYQIETQGCILCLQFHPYKPGLLAAGSFTGEIIVWDLSSDDLKELYRSEIDEYFHRDCVTQILWTPGLNSQTNNLISLGSDGKILVWPINFENGQSNLKYPLKGFNLLRKKDNQIEGVGGICFSQCREDLNNYIIGSEGGSVLKGLLQPVSFEKKHAALLQGQGVTWRDDAIIFMNNINQKFVPEIKQQVDDYVKRKGLTEVQVKHIMNAKPDLRKLYMNPISFAFEAHYGTVFGISNSPFLPDVFLTCSMDGQLRIYGLHTAKSLVTYEQFGTYVLSVQFSPSRPCVFGSCTSTGDLLIYDLKENKKKEVLVIKPSDLKVNQSATNLRFNSKQNDLLAVSYTGGQVKIFQLSDNLVNFVEEEDLLLAKFLNDQKNN